MIGVLIQRRSDFTILGSTLDALMLRGLRFGWVLDLDGKEDPGPGDFQRWGVPIVGLAECDVLLAKETPSIPWIAGPTVTIPYFWDDRLHRASPKHFVCYTSDRHRDFVAAIHGRRDPARSPIVGWTMADHLNLLPREPCPYGVLFTMKQNIPERWRKSQRGKRWYRETCRMIVNEWECRGWTTHVKSREKHDDPRWLRYVGHQYWVDEIMYPHTSWYLILNAKEIIHFGSGVAWQAMVAGVPHRAYRVPRSHLAGLPGQVEIERTLDGTVSREEFLRDWIGVLDGKAGERVADVIEGQV